MADWIAHASFLLSKEHAAVLMSLHPGNAPAAKQLVGKGVQPELAHAARGLMAGDGTGAGSSGG